MTKSPPVTEPRERQMRQSGAVNPPVSPQRSQTAIRFYTATAFLSFVYVFGFNFLPDVARQLLAAALAGSAFAIFFIGATTAQLPRSARVMVAALIVLLGIAIVTLVAYRPLSSSTELFRNFTGMLLVSWALMQRWRSPEFERLLTLLGSLAVAMCILMPLLNDPILRGGTLRMGSITSGNDSLHPSAYLSVIVIFWLVAMGYYKRKIALVLPSAAIITLIIYLYAADAATVIFLFLIATTFLSLFLSRHWNTYLTYVVPVAFVLVVTMFFIILNATPDSWDVYTGSGRIGAWLDRFQRLANRDVIQLLFGEGPGSDDYYGSLTWVGKSTHSHNVFLNVALELGVVGLLAFVTLMVSMVFAAPTYLRYFVALVLIAPFFSGGLLFKPTVAPIMALAILHTRMMHDAAVARRGGRPFRPRLISFERRPQRQPGLAR